MRQQQQEISGTTVAHNLHSTMSRLVLLFGAVALPAISACSGNKSSDPTGSVTHNGSLVTPVEITLAPSTSIDVTAANLHITFDTVTSDSRCPTNVQCVWAGSVVIHVTAAHITGDKILAVATLSTVSGSDTATVFGEPIRLLHVEPGMGTVRPSYSSYRATLKVGGVK